jgi:hypothetical protein
MARAAPRPPSEQPVMRTVRLGLDILDDIVGSSGIESIRNLEVDLEVVEEIGGHIYTYSPELKTKYILNI